MSTPLAAMADRYDVESEHARGGIGVILRAHDRRLDRPVAIKELSETASVNASERFVREALITARLQHPGIVPVYDAGRWPDGSPFYAMRMVSGQTLREEIKARPSLDARLALVPSVLAVAEAVGYAHAEGFIHRDLKPDNVMVGAFGETVVVDWGLARDLRRTARAGAPELDLAGAPDRLTRGGKQPGTPAYMAPEQARGAEVDERADVWALGAVLYHVLAGAPPYTARDAKTRLESPPPRPLDRRVPGVPRDLLAIVEKSMADAPGARYANAKLLAGDLSRFLTGQLVGARVYGRFALAARWLRRNRTAVIVAAVLLTVLGATVAVSVRRIIDERQRARDRGDELVLTQARSQLERDPTAALAWLEQYPPGGARWDAARDVAAEASARGVARHVWRGFPAYVGALTVSPDGARVAGAADGVVQLWDSRTGRRLARRTMSAVAELTFSGDGAALVIAAQDGAVTVIDGPAFAVRRLGAVGGFVTALKALPGQRAVVTGDVTGAVTLWPLDGRVMRVLTRHAGVVYSVQVVDDGAAVVTFATGDLEIRRTPLHSAPVVLLPGAVLQAIEGELGALAIARDGNTVAIGIDDRVLRWVHGMAAPIEIGHHRGVVKAIAIAADGAVVSGADDGSVMRWGGATPGLLVDHHHAITALVVGVDGRVASGDTTGDVRIWTSGGGLLLRGHVGRIHGLAFGADGALYTASADRSVRAWPVSTAPLAIATGTASAFQLAFVAPDTLAVTNEDGRVQWIALPGGVPREVLRFTRQAYGVRRLSRGRFAAASWDGSLVVFGAGGDVERRFEHGAEINGLAASPEGTRLATTGLDGCVRVWDVDTGKGHLLEARHGPTLEVAFSSDGRWLAASGADREVHVIDASGGAPPRTLSGPADLVTALVFGAGPALYAASDAGEVWSWELTSGARRVYRGHVGKIRALALSPDQRYLASGGSDGEILVHDLQHAERMRALRGHTAEVRHLGFSPDGAELASAGWDGSVRLWRITDGAMTVWQADDDKVHRVAFSPDGRLVAATCADGHVRLWPVTDQLWIPIARPALAAWLRSTSSAVIAEADDSAQAQLVTSPP